MVTIIVATDPCGVIGKGNAIPWRIPEDLKLFRDRTLNSSIIMGRCTWDSLPSKPLLGRVNYVISRGPARYSPHSCFAESLAGPIWCKSLEEAVEDAKKNKLGNGQVKEIFIIGGEQIYKLALQYNMVEQIIVSRLRQAYEGDRFFNVPEGWVDFKKDGFTDFDVIYFKKS